MAKRYAETLAAQLRNDGANILELSASQRQDALRALNILKGAATLTAAAQFWAKHHPVTNAIVLRDLAARWLADLRRRGCRETTIREREYKLARLCKDFGDRAAITITKDDITQWLDAWHIEGITADGYRRCFNALYNYGLHEKLLEANPISALQPFRSDERLPQPFTVEDTRRILSACEKFAPVMVPTLAVQFFAGLRPGEAKGLTWENIDWAENHIRVVPETSKMRRSRIVEMNETLRAWLKPYRKTKGPIGITSQNQFDYYMTRKPCGDAKGILGASGVKWIQDGPRKTFASMHYATYSDAAKLAAILGHSGDPGILFKHYRGLVTQKAALQYWQLRPSEHKQQTKVLPFARVV